MTRRELEVTEMSDILYILDESKVLHLGLVDDGMPYIVPMNYGYTMEDGKLTLYLHGANKGYKLDVIRKNPVCCFEMECEVEPFEGKKPCQYGMAYYSLMGRGKVEFVEEVDAKRIFGIMGLAVKQGQEIIMRADGEDEEQAIDVIEKFLTEKM